MKRPKLNPTVRKKILERDGHQCVACDSRGSNRNKVDIVDVHHFWDTSETLNPDKEIQSPYWKTRENELVTLCDSCHGKIGVHPHSRLAKAVREYLKELK